MIFVIELLLLIYLQLIVIYRSDAARFGQPLLWPSFSFPTPWADTMNPNTLFNFLDEGITNRRDQFGFITQCLLTPRFADIIVNVFSRCCVVFATKKINKPLFQPR